MIRLIEGSVASFYPRTMDVMFRGRYDTFVKKMKWLPDNETGRERDCFDDANPLYLISVNPDTGEFQGAVRLLPTTGPNMLRDVFPQLLWEGSKIPAGEYVESATIWESSRIFSVDNKVSVLAELILGMGEVAMMAGLTQIVSVFDARMLKLLRRIVQLDVIGTPQMIGDYLCYAALFDTDESAVQYVREKTGISESVLAPRALEEAGLK